jgi:hypothetical protein
MSVRREQDDESDSDEGSPRRVYVPVRSSAPTPVASAKKVKVNPAHVAEARARAIEQCKTPEEFVKQIVYEGLSAQHVQFATQLPDTWSNLVANNKLHDLIRARRQLADTSIAFWRRLFPVALPIAVSMVGIKHTTNMGTPVLLIRRALRKGEVGTRTRVEYSFIVRETEQ